MPYTTDKIRNIIFLGHQSTGKTSLVESLASVVTGKPKGEIERKNTISDNSPEEKSRLSSCSLSVVSVDYKDYHLNFLDAPGNDDFVHDIIGVLEVVKAAVLVIDATKKIEVGTIKHFNMLKKHGIPTFIFINKMDKEKIDFEALLEEINHVLGKKAVSFVYPIGRSEAFDGFIDVISLKARKYNGTTCVDDEIYVDKKPVVLELHNTLAEQVALTDDTLLDKFFGGETLSHEEISKGLHTAVINGEITPVLVGSAKKDIGVETLLRMMIEYLPDPSELKPYEAFDPSGKVVEVVTKMGQPFSAYVFKTTFDQYKGVTNIVKVNSGVLNIGDEVYCVNSNDSFRVTQISSLFGATLTPVDKAIAGDIVALTKLENVVTTYSLSTKANPIKFPIPKYPTIVYYRAIAAKNAKDEEKLGQALSKYSLEDPCFEMKRNQETKQLLLGGLSDSHLSYVLERIKNSYGIEVETFAPKINYRETIKTTAEAEGRYVKQSGGSGFYGVVVMRFSPSGTEDNVFTEEVFGGAVPRNYYPAVEKGFLEATQKGLLAGFPVIGVKGTLFDGKYHSVDSNEQAFKMAGILAFKEAYNKCKPTLLEPIMQITVQVSNEYTGSIMKDLNQRRARILNMDEKGFGQQEIVALVPESEIMDYAIKLRVMTQGSGFFNRKFDSYQEVPSYVVEQIVRDAKPE
jgi:elongation factor G